MACGRQLLTIVQVTNYMGATMPESTSQDRPTRVGESDSALPSLPRIPHKGDTKRFRFDSL